jgi:Ca-activated chloride channel family protein
VAFAGSAVLVSPLTNDYSIVRTFLNALSVDTIENQGTDIAATIQTSIQAFRRGSARNLNPEDKSHVLILISDGEITSGEIDSGLKLLKENQMILHSIGVGSDKPSPIAIRDVGGNLISYKQDRSGNTVLSSMNESTLKSIAGSTGGIYALSRADDSEIGAIVDGLQKLNRSDTKTMKARIYQEYFQWPLGLGILFFIAIFLLPLFTGIRGLKQTMIFLICTLLGISNISYASSIPDWLLDDQSKKSKTASELFSGEKFSESTSIYKSQQVESPDSKEIAFNTATSLLKEGKKDEARAMLESLASENNSVSSLAQFNLAGSLAEEKKYDEALARYASLAQNLTQKNPRTSNDDKLLTETTKKIELVQKRREEQQKKDQNKDKNKENQEEDKEDKKEDKKDQQGSGNDKESDQANKNDDPSKQEDKDNSKGENEKKDQQQKQQPKFDQRKKFKENETLNEGDAKKILEALRQQEQLLQKKMLQQKTITPRSAPSNGKDW